MKHRMQANREKARERSAGRSALKIERGRVAGMKSVRGISGPGEGKARRSTSRSTGRRVAGPLSGSTGGSAIKLSTAERQIKAKKKREEEA